MLKAENSCNVFDLGDGRYNSKYLVREERSIPEPDRVCGVRTPLFVHFELAICCSGLLRDLSLLQCAVLCFFVGQLATSEK